MIIRIYIFILLFVCIAACEGPVGPAGPAGPEGPAGDFSIYNWWVTGVIAGQIVNDFTPFSGTDFNPPEDAHISTFTCWLSEDGINWTLDNEIPEETDFTCKAIDISEGILGIRIEAGEEIFGWHFMIVVNYIFPQTDNDE